MKREIEFNAYIEIGDNKEIKLYMEDVTVSSGSECYFHEDRLIKKLKGTGWTFEGDGFRYDDGRFIDASEFNIDCYEESVCAYAILLQYTGFKDIDGKKIFEGDILSGHSDGNGVITWSDFDGGYDYTFHDEAVVGIYEVKDRCRVLGNIYENPELLNN